MKKTKHKLRQSEGAQFTTGIPSSKRIVFWSVLLAVPIFLLLLAELILRVSNYGGNLDLVVKTTVMGKEYYSLNRHVARRYFTQKGVGIPEAYDDIFEIRKRSDTRRIFMLGESTMAGYPFDYNATAPRLLKDRLVQLLPQYNIEVVNVGLAAVNSYTVRDFIQELVDYEPDAFVVYLGHNEFYGAMGIGSTEYLGQWRFLVNLYLELRTLKLFLLIRDGVVALRGLFAHDVTPRETTLMEVMVREKAIPHNGREYRIAKKNFESNLRDIIEIAGDRRVPLVLSTLVSNVRDQKPLLTTFSEATPPEDRFLWENLVDHGEAALQIGNVEDALLRFQQAIEIDTMNAKAHFLLAKCLDTLGRFPDAMREYERARDYDGLRFRASSDFNELIRAICREENIPLADAEKAFEQDSPDGLVGSNLVLEHLHPNFDGYFLLARTFFQAIVDNQVAFSRSDWSWERNLRDDEFKQQSGVTEFELEVARFRIFQLTSGWPFTQESARKPEYQVNDKIRELAAKYARKQIAWSQAHYEIAEWYIGETKYEKALREFYAVFKVVPYYYYPLMRVGDMYRILKKAQEAEEAYRQALRLQNSPFVRVRLGMLYYDSGKTGEAIQEFEATFVSEAQGAERMNTKDRSTAYYLLAVAYGKSGNFQKARENLQIALQIDPANEDARELLEKLPG